MLKDGKPKDAPTDYSSSIRVRAMDTNNAFSPNEGQRVFGLQVSPEPHIIWQNLLNIKITKAVDDKDQTLAQGDVEIPNALPQIQPGIAIARRGGLIRAQGWGIVYPGIHQEIPVYLKKGAKNSKTLKELSGVIQCRCYLRQRQSSRPMTSSSRPTRRFTAAKKGGSRSSALPR